MVPYVRIGKASDVPPGRVIVCPVGDREIALCNADGTLYAIDNVCSHDEGSLDQGELLGLEVECPRHGARFDIRTGDVTEGPAVLPIDAFPVRVIGDEVEIEV